MTLGEGCSPGSEGALCHAMGGGRYWGKSALLAHREHCAMPWEEGDAGEEALPVLGSAEPEVFALSLEAHVSKLSHRSQLGSKGGVGCGERGGSPPERS